MYHHSLELLLIPIETSTNLYIFEFPLLFKFIKGVSIFMKCLFVIQDSNIDLGFDSY